MTELNENAGRVLLVGWDSAQWEYINPLLDRGELPHLQGVVDNGLIGTLRTRGPRFPHLVHNTVATGKYGDKHGVLGPLEVKSDGNVGWTTSRSRRALTFWEILSHQGRRCNVVNFPTTEPAEKIAGTFVAPRFFGIEPLKDYGQALDPLDTVSPRGKAEALSEFIVSLAEIPPDAMASFVPRFRELDPANPWLFAIGQGLAVTMSVHAVVTYLMENEPWQLTAVHYPLIDILGLRFLKYHPPQRESVGLQEYELFQEVMTTAYHICDLLLGRLLELAGEDTSVIVYSPFGFPPSGDVPEIDEGSRFPAPVSPYLGDSIFAMRAGGFPKDELLHEVSFLDICPTVLRLSGLPTGADMDGHAVQDSLVGAGDSSEKIPSWEAEAPSLSRQTSDTSRDFQDPLSIRLTEPFASKLARNVELENLWTLARIQLSSGRREESLPLLLKLYNTHPLDVERGAHVADALYRCGYMSQAIEIMYPLAETFPDRAIGSFMSGLMALERRDMAKALELMGAAEKEHVRIPRFYNYLGHVYLSLDRREEALKAYTRAVEMNPGLVASSLGLSEAYLRLHRYEDAAEAALMAVGSNFANPAVHVALGRALAQLSQTDRAREAYQTAIKFDANDQIAQEHLEALDQFLAQPKTLDPKLISPPLLLKIHEEPGSRTHVKQALAGIKEWRDQYMDDLEAADSKLDEYLDVTANASARQNDDVSPEPALLQKIADEHWVVRRVEPADQPVVRRLFKDPFSAPLDNEILVTHRAGSQAISGGVMLLPRGPNGTDIELQTQIASEKGELDSDHIEYVFTRLVRAAVVRSAAGCARRVKCTVRQGREESPLYRCVRRLGFETIYFREVFTSFMAEFRDLCLALEDRYRQKNKLPDELRISSMEEIPRAEVDAFMRQWFAEGIGDPPGEIYPRLCPVILLGDQIVACCVGYEEDADTFTVTRSCVLKKYRRGWATASLYGHGSRVAAEHGYSTLEFHTDEQFPEFKKIAERHMHAESKGTIRTMALEFSRPWPTEN